MLEEVKQLHGRPHLPERGTSTTSSTQELGKHGYPPILDKLKAAARERGLWNLFLPHLAPDAPGTKLSNLDYAPISEQLGKVGFASEALNCAAPDTGNMEILNLYGSETVKQRLAGPAARGRDPLGVLDDRARRRPRPTPPTSACASSATATTTCSTARSGSRSGALGRALQGADRDGQDRPERVPPPAAVDDRGAEGHARHLASAARRTCSATTTAAATPRSIYENVRVPADNLLGEEGGGFAISQARLGPGRIHHCMRSIGVAERALELMVERCAGAHARSARSSPRRA